MAAEQGASTRPAATSRPDCRSIAVELNKRSHGHPIGALQEVRAVLKGKSHRNRRDIFHPRTMWDTYAFHFGGRSELQFNIGIEDDSGDLAFRHGVAFSFRPSRNLRSPVEILAPKVKLFNDFMALNAELFRDLRMWHFERDRGGGRTRRSADYGPGPIPYERVKDGVFVFLGRGSPADQVDYELVLGDWDRLLPLYEYVEGGGASPPVSTRLETSFQFRPGYSAKASSTVVSWVQKQLDVTLRHNALQEALCRQLVSQYGIENVGAEAASGVGTFIDAVVQRGEEYWFYEIKTFQSPRACLREAIGQLLEYAFWPGAQRAVRLIVVGETAIDDDGLEYLHRLKERFALPIEYEQISVGS